MLEILDIRKEAGGQRILEGVNLSIAEGEFFSLLGPSGCGKTTLLRILSGLETADGGEIRLNGTRVDPLPPQRRPFNMVFQKYALFPHLSVRENVAYGLRLKRLPADEIRQRCERVLERVGMKRLADRKPETLSGGQAQRVAVARALVNEPKVLLLDEPLSALDQKMREHMQGELRDLQKGLRLTFVYVTHDQEEAMALSDRIGVMNRGRLEQVGTPRELYDEPVSVFSARFVGRMSCLRGELVERREGYSVLRLADGRLIAGRCPEVSEQGSGQISARGSMQAFVRPERIRLSNGAENPGVNHLQGRLIHRVYKGDQTELHLDAGPSGFLTAVLPGAAAEWSVGSSVHIAFAPEDTILFGDGE